MLDIESLFPAGDWLTAKEVAAGIGVDAKTVRNLIEEGRLLALRVSAGRGERTAARIPRRAAVAYVAENLSLGPGEQREAVFGLVDALVDALPPADRRALLNRLLASGVPR